MIAMLATTLIPAVLPHVIRYAEHAITGKGQGVQKKQMVVSGIESTVDVLVNMKKLTPDEAKTARTILSELVDDKVAEMNKTGELAAQDRNARTATYTNPLSVTVRC